MLCGGLQPTATRTLRALNKRKMDNLTEPSGSELARQAEVAAAEDGRGSRAWLWGAYTFLFLWGMTYLVLFFTDRLPI